MRTFPLPHVPREAYPPLDPATQDLSIIQAQALCQVSRRTVYNWLAQGKVDYVRHAGGAVRIFADTLLRDPEPRA